MDTPPGQSFAPQAAKAVSSPAPAQQAPQPALTHGRLTKILVVDDEDTVSFFVQRGLIERGYVCDCSRDGLEALQRVRRDGYDVVICDVCLPDVSGLEVLRSLKAACPDTSVIMLSACADVSVAVPALRAGAADYLLKPFHMEELAIAVERAIERRALEIENRSYQQALEEKVKDRTRELVQKNRDLSNLVLNTIGSLVSVLEARDTYTEGHSWKVAVLAAELGRKVGLDNETVENLSIAGLLHDIGKIGIRDAVLNKPAKLTEDEFEQIKQHPVIGERILAPLAPLRELLPCIRHHHEWYNGNGYPDRIAGEAIPLTARILTVADCFDAITSHRAYRPARSRDEAVAIIRGSSGQQFDPALVEPFLAMNVP